MTESSTIGVLRILASRFLIDKILKPRNKEITFSLTETEKTFLKRYIHCRLLLQMLKESTLNIFDQK